MQGISKRAGFVNMSPENKLCAQESVLHQTPPWGFTLRLTFGSTAGFTRGLSQLSEHPGADSTVLLPPLTSSPQEEVRLLQLALEFRDTSTELPEKSNNKEPVYLLVLKELILKYDKLTASSLVSKSARH